MPIGESLWFGKTCVTSKTSSMPEVGRDMCSYVDPSNLDELYAEARRMIVDLPYRRQFESRIAREKLRTWSDVAKNLWSALTAGLAIDPPRDDAPEDRVLPGPPTGAASPRGADWESAS